MNRRFAGLSGPKRRVAAMSFPVQSAAGLAKTVLDGPRSTTAPLQHHHRLAANRADRVQVMADHDDLLARFSLQLSQQLENLLRMVTSSAEVGA